MPTNKPEVVLPKLPASYGDHCVTDSVRTMREPGYTADHLRAYGQACIDALHDKVLIFLHHLEDVMDEHPEVEGWIDHKLWNAISLRSATRVDTLTRPAAGDFVMVPREVLDRFPEINPSNYDHDDACALNAWGVELVLSAAPHQSGQEVRTCLNTCTPSDFFNGRACEKCLSTVFSPIGISTQQPAEVVAPPKNWCPTCNKRPNDPEAVFCSDPFHKPTIIDNAPPAIDIGKLREVTDSMVHRACAAHDPMYDQCGNDTRADMQASMRRALMAALIGGGGEKGNG